MKDESLNGATEQADGKTSDAALDSGAGKVDHSRRKLAKVGMAAPVLVTLAGKPVFGNPTGPVGRCLSNLMSGNLSTEHIQSCSRGVGPVSWQDPNLSILGTPAWTNTLGYVHSTSGDSCTSGGGGTVYAGGTILGDTALQGLGANGITDDALTLAAILCDASLQTKNGHELRNCVAALLNARFSASGAMAGFHYILDEYFVEAYCFNPGAIQGFGFGTDVDAFLQSTFFTP